MAACKTANLGREFTYRRLEWDEELIGRLISIEDNFWNQHVVQGIIPPPDGSRACDEVIEQYFHTARKESTIELVGFDENQKIKIIYLLVIYHYNTRGSHGKKCILPMMKKRNAGKYGFVKLLYYTDINGFENMQTYTDSKVF